MDERETGEKKMAIPAAANLAGSGAARRMKCIALVLLLALSGCRSQASGLGAGADGSASVAWTQFQDPMEHAFTVDVPRDWTVHGGLYRLGYSDERLMVDMQSKDGSVAVRLGDVAIPSYALPTPYHTREGEVYDLGAQAQLIVAAYRTGPEFAVLYSQARFHGLCSSPQPDTTDAGFTVPDYLPIEGSDQTSAGQIAWRCQAPGGVRVAFAYTRTMRAQGIWQVPTIVSIVAPPEKAAAARAIALHAAGSLHLSPEWLEYQKRMDAEGLQYQRVRQQGRMQALQQQVQQFQAQMQAMKNQVNAFEQHQAAQAAQVQGFTNVLNGITPTTDPLTGEQRDVWTGTKANYWVNGTGQVVNSTDAPAAGWRKLDTN
jgi:hypothetical protein